MIILSIEITNFLSYYDKNRFDFNSGATIIIGQNNTGKSKLFDAYNWVLYDNAYDTAAEEWPTTNLWKEGIVNRFAMKNCLVGKKVEMSVVLTFEDDHQNRFVITREYEIHRTSNGWSCATSSDLYITKSDRGTFNSTNFAGEDAKSLLLQFFPRNLSRYFLFQGESISRLLRLNQRSDFTKAIGELSGIKYFDKAKRYAERVFLRMKDEFENKEDLDKELQEQKVNLVKLIGEAKEKISSIDNKLENEIKERDLKQAKLEEKIEELSRYEDCARLLGEIKNLEEQLQVKVDQRRQLFDSQRSAVMTRWVYAHSGSLFQNFLDLYRIGKEQKRIPEPIRQDFIQEMLFQHLCKVCGTPAPKDSPQYLQISTYINEKSLDQEIAVINTLSDTADVMKISVNEVMSEVNHFNEQLSELQEEIKKARSRVGYKEDELRIATERIEEEQKGVKINRKDLERVNLVQLKKDRDQIRADLEQSRTKIDQLTGRKDEAGLVLSELEKQYQALVEKSSNEKEKDRLKLAGDIRTSINALYDNFLNKLIKDIEEESNTYFDNMTKLNPALSGRVRVDYDDRSVYTVDERGIPITNINQGNKVSLQISFVAAVLSVSNKIWEKHFPFVADAPLSVLGGNNKIGAVKTMIDIFTQSIIIIKDDAEITNPETIKNDQVRQLISLNNNISNAYELRMHSASSVEEQYTEVLKIK